MQYDSLDGAPSEATSGSASSKPGNVPRAGCCTIVYRSFTSHLPDARSRFAFAFAFIVALIGALYWLVYTVESKWLYDRAHPLQSVSYDAVTSLPAIFGLDFIYNPLIVPALGNVTLWRDIAPFMFRVETNAYYRAPAVNCNATSPDLNLCQAIDPSTGRPWINIASAPAGELDGSSANRNRGADFSDWPTVFTNSLPASPQLCFASRLLVNRTEMLRQQLYSNPSFTVSSLSVQTLLSTLELQSAGHVSLDDPLVQQYVNPNANWIGFFQYDCIIGLRFQPTRHVAVDGSARLEYTFAQIGQVPLTAEELYQDFLFMVHDVPSADRDRVWQQYRDPSTQFYSNRMCLAPQSFSVQVIKSSIAYGWTSFLADVGGFVNLLSLIMLALFPVTMAAVKPRDFLPIWIGAKWRNRGKTSEDNGNRAMQMRSVNDAAHGASHAPPTAHEPVQGL